MAIQGKFYDARLFAGAYELTGLSNTVQLVHNAAMLDITTMSMATKANAPGIKEARLDAAGFMSTVSAADLTDQQLFNNVGSATIPVTFFPTTTSVEGSIAYFMSAAQPDYTVGGSHGQLAPYKFSAVPGTAGYPLVRGYILEPGSVARSTSSNGTGTNNPGAASATQTIYAALHVMSVSAADTLDVTIVSDDNSGFTSATTRFTFTQATAITSQFMTLAGPVTDTYWRANWVVGGGAISITFCVVIGII